MSRARLAQQRASASALRGSGRALPSANRSASLTGLGGPSLDSEPGAVLSFDSAFDVAERSAGAEGGRQEGLLPVRADTLVSGSAASKARPEGLAQTASERFMNRWEPYRVTGDIHEQIDQLLKRRSSPELELSFVDDLPKKLAAQAEKVTLEAKAAWLQSVAKNGGSPLRVQARVLGYLAGLRDALSLLQRQDLTLVVDQIRTDYLNTLYRRRDYVHGPVITEQQKVQRWKDQRRLQVQNQKQTLKPTKALNRANQPKEGNTP